MKHPHTKKYVPVLIIVAVILQLLALVLSLPFLAIGCEGTFTKLRIHNSYVNKHYRNWECVSIQGFDGFRIPEHWSVAEDDGLYTIYDAAGTPWAYGAAFGTERDCFVDYKELISKAYSLDISKLEIDPFTQFAMMDGSDIDLVIVQEPNNIKNIYCIQMLESAQTTFVWFLTTDISADPEQYDIAEAIVYSYAFGKA